MKRSDPIRIWAVLFWLALWQLLASEIDQSILIVSPVQVIVRLFQLAVTLTFWKTVAYSLLRIAAGFIIGTVVGIVLAALSARFRYVAELLAPAMLAIRSIPVASFIILALIFFSSKNLAVFISFLMVLPIVYASILEGIRSADTKLLEMAHLFRVPPLRCVRYVYLPQVLPYFRSACGSALGLCWKAGIAAEVIGIPTGSVGERLQQAKIYLDTPDLFAWTLVIVLVSLAFERFFSWLIALAAKQLKRM